jgi:hypothetical protein
VLGYGPGQSILLGLAVIVSISFRVTLVGLLRITRWPSSTTSRHAGRRGTHTPRPWTERPFPLCKRRTTRSDAVILRSWSCELIGRHRPASCRPGDLRVQVRADRACRVQGDLGPARQGSQLRNRHALQLIGVGMAVWLVTRGKPAGVRVVATLVAVIG